MNSALRLLLFLFLALNSVGVFAQTKENSAEERQAAKIDAEYVKKMEKWEKENSGGKAKRRAGDLSLRNFIRGGLQTGNLIQVPYITNVNLSGGYWGGYVSPDRIIWPKGSGVEYGYVMSLLAAAEVIDDDNETHVIISESYNRSSGDHDPDGSHKYQFTAIPGFYNMYGDRTSENQLNDNANDRTRLEETGYYFVGGLNEDANNNGELDSDEDLNNNGELDTQLENRIEYSSQSNLPETWPAFWPPQTYPGDNRAVGDNQPGVRAGKWNGAYGAYVRADQEAFYKADDRDNDEFPYYPFINPDTGEPDNRKWEEGGKRGLGLEISVRQYQWASVIAEDILVATFDVKNISRNDINKSIIGMLVDYDIGGSSSNDRALFDTQDDITYQWDKFDLIQNGYNVGYGGVGFLESPGIAYDGIDNDSDGMVDEDREDGIDNDGDWETWEDIDGNGRYDNEDLNNNFKLDAGEDVNGNGILDIEPINDDKGSDGIGPEDENYPGADVDGTEANGFPDAGEPNYEFTDNDEIDQIGLTNMVIRTPGDFDRDLDDDELFWKDYIQPVPESEFIVPEETADVMYAYSSGIVTIPKGTTQRFSIAFFCGNDFDDMLRNKRTMQNIYDADYDFAKPPRRPFLTAVPGDDKVTLVWDENAESSRDPIYGTDFEMYKIYKSSDPEFNEIKTITDAFGNPLLWEALAQFDLKNGLKGAHPVPIGEFGISYDMGTDSGLEHNYIDNDVDNGRTYYYAVVAVDQGYGVDFYDKRISELEGLAPITPTECSKIIEVDAFEQPINVDRNAAAVIPQARATGYVEPALEGDEVNYVTGKATGEVNVEFLIPDSANEQGYEYEITFTDDNSYFLLDSTLLEYGNTTGFTLKNKSTGEILASSDPSARGSSIFDSPVLNARTYDGMKISINNPLTPEIIDSKWVYIAANGQTPTMAMNVNADEGTDNKVPRDYEIRISEMGADTSESINEKSRIPTNFTIWDVTYPNMAYQVPFSITEKQTPVFPQDTVAGMLTPGDLINLKISAAQSRFGLVYTKSTWRIDAVPSSNASFVLADIKSTSNAFYDSLAIYKVRGTEVRVYGADLEGAEIIDFLDMTAVWYNDVKDSLLNNPETNNAFVEFEDPSVYKKELDNLFASEVPVTGDIFFFETDKPFNRSDTVLFKVNGNFVESEIPKSVLDSIFVAPDPYIVVNPLEPRNSALPGRGERRIDFRNLPQLCTIKIFTMSGRLVKTLEHSSSEYASIQQWNLKSDDGLDVAYGVYIYHVDAPGIGEKIGRFALIK